MLIKGFGKSKLSPKINHLIEATRQMYGDNFVKDYIDLNEADDGLIWSNVENYNGWQIRMCYDPMSNLYKAFGFDKSAFVNEDGEHYGDKCETKPNKDARECGRNIMMLIDLMNRRAN